MLVLDQPEELDEREGVQQSNSVELAPTSYTAYSQTNPDVNVDIQTTAYIAYTSGSTGTPKGILQSHRNMCQFIHWFSSQFQIRPEQRIAQWSSFTFDAAYVSILSTLCFGATLCLTTPSKRMDPAAVIDWLGREQINQLETVPSFLRSVVAEIARQTSSQSGSPLPALEFLLLGGEVVPVSLAQNILQLPGRHRYLYNLYGPTESTLATFYEVRHVQPGQSSVPIGNPIPGRQILILDEAGRPCPDYIVGEIVIRGSYLSEGYFRQPQETQKTFQADPFTARSGLRLYRTGDLGRWLADGTIEYCGRKDMQVKIRGMRVELEEIEAVLQAHTSINACAVAIHSLKASSDPVDQHLVAYVVANRPETEMRSQGLAEFQDYLKNRLPGHMRPAAWVFLEQLPRTSTGKVDRRALPPPDWQHMGSTRAVYKAPRTPLEEVVAGIWAEVLHIEQIGRDDNFFALGGHSLLATQVIVRLRDIFQRDLPLSLLFEAPTVAQLGASIEQTREVALHIPPLQPMPRQEEIALSFAQQRLWFLDQWEPGASLYNAPLAIQLGGNLQWQALLASMQRIVERHEALRTTFANQQGLPRQVIAASLAVKMPLIDLSSLPEEIREQAARQLTIQEAQKPFNLAQGPLLRACLLRLHQQTHVLLITLHHIITDGWSMDILLHELSTCYQALIDNQQPQLPALAVQYTDYALWQRQWLQGTVLDEQLNYWQERLADLPMLDLPVDYPYPPVQSYRGAVQRFALPHSLLEGLQQLCQREGVTLFMALLAAFQTLLARYSGQEDIVVGTTIANRSRPELEGLIGFFANTLVLRTDLRGDPAFQVLLGRVRKTCLEAYTYQDLPFERLVEELHPERNISRPPLVQVLFVLQNAPVGASSLSDLELQPIERKSEHTTSRFELTVSLHESTQGLSGTIEYCTDLFNATTIKHLVEHWHLLLEGIVAQPALRLSTLPLLRSDERELLLHNWNMTERHYSQPNSLHQLFEVQVQSTPDAIALTFEEQQITYAELNERANQLAHALRRLGIRSESLVGLGVERSLDMVIGLLGILKAGGAYVPLEPEYPGERLSFLLQDTGITVILTQQKLRERFLASTSAAHVLCLDTDASLFAANPTSPLINITQPAHLAYVIYTSGSTGTPKGVMNTHKGVSNRLAWMQETYQLHGGERVLQKTPFSFDVSVWEFFWPLMTGACLVIARPGGQRDSSYLRQLIVQQHISTLHFVPSMLQAFLIENGLEQCRGLKRVICSGETLPFEVVHTFHHKLAGVALHNLYGPTEAAIDVTYWRYQPESELTVVPIGRPVANTQLYVLDTHMQPVPIGSTGELYIGGIQLARGYLNRPELTAERFVPDPFRVSSDARLYRTGDLVRYLPDGNLEFLGRLDQQVKIRGFRIEPGEIEATLRKHPEVREVVVVTQEEATAEKRLIAYVVPQHEQPASSALREYMLQRLPDYTLPSAFVFLESLPLTTNGKINRGALPAPDAHRPDLENVYMPPQTPLQQTLVEIWQQVLRLERVGIHDNFFLVGGHSLLAAQVVARVRTTLNVEIAVRLLFEKPTIADLAGAIGKLKNSTPPVEEQPLQPVPRAAYRVKRSSLESDSRGG